jgi:ankyrin repeat protein
MSENNSDLSERLGYAAGTRNLEVAKRLLLDGCDPSSRWDGAPCILIAVKSGAADVLRLLLDAGAAVDATDRERYTALMWAVIMCDCGSVRVLLHHGADPEVANHAGLKATDYARIWNRQEIAPLLVRR